MEIAVSIEQKGDFFARIFEMYCHFIISGTEAREERVYKGRKPKGEREANGWEEETNETKITHNGTAKWIATANAQSA